MLQRVSGVASFVCYSSLLSISCNACSWAAFLVAMLGAVRVRGVVPLWLCYCSWVTVSASYSTYSVSHKLSIIPPRGSVRVRSKG